MSKKEDKIRLLFVVPYPELKDKVEFVISNDPQAYKINIDIRVMTVEEMTEISDERKYEAVIARGYSAKKVRSITERLPVIDLTISGYDIVRAVVECKRLISPNKIAIFSSDGPLYEAKELCGFLGCKAEVYVSERHENLEQFISKAKADGCDAVIGGYAVKLLAEKQGLPSVIIRTGEETIQQALNRAIQIVEQIRKEHIISEMYKTIIYASKEGILYVDTNGIIQVRNHVIREMQGTTHMLHRTLKEALPFLEEAFKETIITKREIFGKIYTFPKTKITVSVDFTPVVVGGKASGVVINVSDITKIQELEGQIRRKLGEKGLQAKHTFDDIIYESEVMRETIEEARCYAESEANVIIVGETGTGKELFAQSIHNVSRRKTGPFVAINCAALPESLLESELFGYVEGAFTGTAKGGKMGLFEQAHGGSLFLDEIGEISLSIQTKLLRAIQEKEIRRIGDNKVISVNVRIISATNKNIRKLCEQGDFRRDLMYRLDVLRICIPPLRKREQDIQILFKYFLKMYGAGISDMPVIDEKAMLLFRQYSFKGNIRELENIAERILVLYRGKYISYADMLKILYPEEVEDDIYGEKYELKEEKNIRIQTSKPESVIGEKELILWALNQSQGNQTKAAKLLGIDRSTLWRKKIKYNI